MTDATLRDFPDSSDFPANVKKNLDNHTKRTQGSRGKGSGETRTENGQRQVKVVPPQGTAVKGISRTTKW